MAVTTIYPWLDKPLEFLKRMSSKLPNAVLIYGPRGCGTFELGVAFAQFLLCKSPDNTMACGKCSECKLVESGNHPDFKLVLSELEAKNHPEVLAEPIKVSDRKSISRLISIEQIRDATEFLSTTSKRGGHRIVLIYPANLMLGTQSSALLKTLEEPPSGSILILVSDNLDSMLPTIRSRCQLVTVAPPTKEQGIAFLKAKKVKNPEEVLAKYGGLPLLYFEKDEKLSLDEERQEELLAFLIKGGKASSADVVYLTGREFPTLPLIIFLQRWVNDLILGSMGQSPRYFLKMKDKIRAVSKNLDSKKLFMYLDELTTAQRATSIALNAKIVSQDLLLNYIRACTSKDS